MSKTVFPPLETPTLPSIADRMAKDLAERSCADFFRAITSPSTGEPVGSVSADYSLPLVPYQQAMMTLTRPEIDRITCRFTARTPLRSPHLVVMPLKKQFRFPLSKKRRIRRKWAKDPRNFRPRRRACFKFDVLLGTRPVWVMTPDFFEDFHQRAEAEGIRLTVTRLD